MLRRATSTPERVELLRSWRHSGFRVDARRRGDRHGLEALLRYMERLPVALTRLEYRPDGRVLYRGKYHRAFGTDHRLVSGLEFLAILVHHVALRYECRIHAYGALSNTIRRQLGWIEKKGKEQEADNDEVVVAEEEENKAGFVKVRKRT